MTAEIVPLRLTADHALRVIRDLAADSNNIVVLNHALRHGVTRRQIETCARKGTIVEGPFLNARGNWQVTMQRHAAGEEIQCVIAIEWKTHIIAISSY